MDSTNQTQYHIDRLLTRGSQMMTVQYHLRESIKTKQELIKQHHELRQKHLQELQSGYAALGEEEAAKRAQAIAKKETEDHD
jgi:hypothetical protein